MLAFPSLVAVLLTFSYLTIFKSPLLVIKSFLAAIDFFFNLDFSTGRSFDYLCLMDFNYFILGFMNEAYS